MQRKLFSLILLYTILILSLFGCGNDTASVDPVSYAEFPQKVKELGIEFETEDMLASFIGAEEGIKLTVTDSGHCELYRFNPESAAYQDFEKTGTIELFGQEYEFLPHDGFGLLIDDDFPKHDKVIEIYQRLRQ